MIRYLSLFSGIESATIAWRTFGWEAVAFAEIEPLPCSVLKHRFPEVKNLGDVKNLTESKIRALGHIDLVVFGFPCQDLSVAGKRAGLKGERSGLFFTAMRIVRWSRARFALFGNVPGLFSSEQGRDFAAVVGEMVGLECDVPDSGWRNTGVALGPGGLLEWSILDAQWFGVPQRRRRIFALADFGDWHSRAPVLLESESLCGYPPPRREAGEGFTHPVAPSLTGSGRGVERCGESRGQDPVVAVPNRDGGLIAFGGNNTTGRIDVATACNAKGGSRRLDFDSETFITHTLRAMPHDGRHANGGGHMAVALNLRGSKCGSQAELGGQVATALRTGAGGSSKSHTLHGSVVRRLTPREAERLMGFPDDFTLVPFRGRLAADGNRYKALGNSIAVPCLTWIAKRMTEVLAKKAAA